MEFLPDLDELKVKNRPKILNFLNGGIKLYKEKFLMSL